MCQLPAFQGYMVRGGGIQWQSHREERLQRLLNGAGRAESFQNLASGSEQPGALLRLQQMPREQTVTGNGVLGRGESACPWGCPHPHPPTPLALREAWPRSGPYQISQGPLHCEQGQGLEAGVHDLTVHCREKKRGAKED